MADDVDDATMHTNNVLHEVMKERLRQAEKGFDAAHDDGHSGQELATAVSATLRAGMFGLPSPHKFFGKEKTRREWFVIAAALMVAEIERIDRASGAVSARAELPPAACPHSDPFRYCMSCVVDPCPMGLGSSQEVRDGE